MELRCLSEERGIYAIYQGDARGYAIYSSFYGIVALSTNIERCEDRSKVKIKFDICDWTGYWSLRNIITRGVSKMEKKFKEDKVVEFEFNVIKELHMENIATLDISVNKRY